MDIKTYVSKTAAKAKEASKKLATTPTKVKNAALMEMADRIMDNEENLVRENYKDLTAGQKKGLSKAMLDRLTLNPSRIKAMADGLREIVALPDPVGEVTKIWKRPNGMQVGRVRVPIGLIGIVYESRPNVTADAASLCLKTGNGVILRGGSEAIHSNTAIVKILKDSCEAAGIPREAVSFIETTERDAVMEMLKQDAYIDLIIPRGGEELIKRVTENSRIPVIKHDKGVCHTYVDEYADLDMARDICMNAKVQRPGTCNAMECMLVHAAVAGEFLPWIVQDMKAAKVTLVADAKARKLVKGMKVAKDEDWYKEYNDLVLNVKIVESMEEAMEHIAKYGSQHSEAIVTRDHGNAMRFVAEVDASGVFVNASTRLNDGGQFGLGAEIGISTTRIHARGPMGLEELTSQKFIVLGTGQVRE
ncbi:MAG: glutamate-5-semialdehyde dehydrogenase [Nitrospirae bacterium]|nr:glutamate-5-semialdehyde dehydrogenase [Nitrospirota bacterium]